MGELASVVPLVQGISSAAGGFAQNGASVARGAYERSAGNMNAELAMQQAAEVTKAGEVSAGRRLQQSALDASTVATNSTPGGSAARSVEDVRRAAIQDAATIRHNAALQAWGLGVEGINYKTRGRMGYIAGRNEGAQSLIQGGLGFARGMAEAGYMNSDAYQQSKNNPKVPTKQQWIGKGWD